MQHAGREAELTELSPLQGPPRGCCSGAALARLVTAVSALAEGYDIGCISGALVLLRQDIPLSSIQVGVLVSSMYFSVILGAPAAGEIADAWGRKMALGITYVVLIASNLTMALAQSFSVLLLGRCLMGVGIGAGLSVVTAYITEVSPKRARARFVCLEELFVISGLTVGYAFNFLLLRVEHNWRWMFAIGAVPTLLALCLLFLPQLPESPRWMLLRDEHRDKAEVTLASIVGQEEARQMLVEWESQAEQTAATWPQVICPRSKSGCNSMMAGLGVMMAQQATGIPILSMYMGEILTEEMTKDRAFFGSLVVGSFRVLFLIASIFCLLDRLGRRPLLLASSGGMTLCMVALVALFSQDAHHLGKLIALAGFACFHSLGLGPGAFLYVAEVLETRVRSKGVSLGILLTRVTSACGSLAFPMLANSIGLEGVFALMLSLNVVAFAFIYVCVPETKDIALESLHEVFEKGIWFPSHRPSARPSPRLWSS